MDVLSDLDFQEVDGPPDAVPPVIDVVYPCRKCGREVGYRGRGRKPTTSSLCADCKPRPSTVKLTVNANNLATQAARRLVQINSMVAMLGAAVGLFQSASAIVGYQETFEAQAFAALSTDTELCKAILKTGAKSAKLSLALAYGGMAVAIAPAVVFTVNVAVLAAAAAGVVQLVYLM